MPLLDVNGQQMFYAARALNRRPLLLLIHGAAGSHLDWPPQLRTLRDFGVCALDLPGHGRSALPGRVSVDGYADDVMAMVTSLELTEIILVGHSMGGAIAMRIALRWPEKIIGVVLVATGARLKVREILLDLVAADYEQAVKLITGMAWSQDAPADVVTRGQALMLRCNPAAVEMDYLACNGFDVMGELDAITIPTLVLAGAEDRLTPPKYGRFLAESIPSAEYGLIAGAGHMLAQEQPEAVSAAILDFIRRRLIR